MNAKEVVSRLVALQTNQDAKYSVRLNEKAVKKQSKKFKKVIKNMWKSFVQEWVHAELPKRKKRVQQQIPHFNKKCTVFYKKQKTKVNKLLKFMASKLTNRKFAATCHR